MAIVSDTGLVTATGEISAADAAAVLRYAAALGAGEPDALLTNFL